MISTMPGLFYRLPRNVITIFSGRNLGWHALAIVLTLAIVMSGSDWHYYLSTRGNVILQLARPAILLGGLVPIWGTLFFLLVGAVGKNQRIMTTAWALGQAAIIGSLLSSAYKAFTGRIPPPFARHFGMAVTDTASLPDTSHGFQFGILKGGMFWGWPSSHTTIAFAMAVCLITLYPGNKKLFFGALAYALYIGLGVSVTIHWFSEFVAGVIIGSVIGMVVGRSFKIKLV
jgi:membrane-associated phospholipid phosphatase